MVQATEELYLQLLARKAMGFVGPAEAGRYVRGVGL